MYHSSLEITSSPTHNYWRTILQQIEEGRGMLTISGSILRWRCYFVMHMASSNKRISQMKTTNKNCAHCDSSERNHHNVSSIYLPSPHTKAMVQSPFISSRLSSVILCCDALEHYLRTFVLKMSMGGRQKYQFIFSRWSRFKQNWYVFISCRIGFIMF